jgi:hypothetical protein
LKVDRFAPFLLFGYCLATRILDETIALMKNNSLLFALLLLLISVVSCRTEDEPLDDVPLDYRAGWTGLYDAMITSNSGGMNSPTYNDTLNAIIRIETFATTQLNIVVAGRQEAFYPGVDSLGRFYTYTDETTNHYWLETTGSFIGEDMVHFVQRIDEPSFHHKYELIGNRVE